MTNDDTMMFQDEDEPVTTAVGVPVAPPWRILVVDDDIEVHAITRLALRQFRFEDRTLELISAYSAAEARKLLSNTTDIALILLDVVMETDEAGLDLVRYIRQVIGNRAVRIVLRTGQPGIAPRGIVISDFDINDYKDKTELTHDRLIACAIVALRSYRDIMRVEASNLALRRIAESATGLFRENTMYRLVEYGVVQLAAVLGESEVVFCVRQLDHSSMKPEIDLVAGTGRYSACIGKPYARVLAAEEAKAVERCLSDRRHRITPERAEVFIEAPDRWVGVALIPRQNAAVLADETLSPLVDMFVSLISAALENVYLVDELRRSNKATVVALADLAESKDTDTGEHVLRVARLTGEIARELNTRSHPEALDPIFVEQVGLASMLHDVGKVGIPDHILKKEGRLTPEERTIIETHPSLGGKTLEKARQLVSGSSTLTFGWEIATAHHETFDGSGYPKGLKGLQIPLSARITAVSDVFDALTMKRSYKSAWSRQDAVAYILEHSGTRFDPQVVDAFLTVIADRATSFQIQWTPVMSVGNERLDNDHQVLVELINQLGAAAGDNNRSAVEFVIDELVQYTLLHFAREEEMLEQAGYQELNEHRNLHIVLTQQVQTLRTRFLNGLTSHFQGDILEFLADWLTNHILKEDRRYISTLAKAENVIVEPVL
ncbi:MAG: bacteriohemerythrin [Rhodospirillaceae bacterium]